MSISKKSFQRILWILLLLTGILLVTIAVKRDIFYKDNYNPDLRNRIVGARLIKDGRSPYYYKWKETDGIRYYDPEGFFYKSVNNITASPFFHRLLIPFCELPQSKISVIWLWLQYGMFAIIVLVAVSFCRNFLSRYFTIAIALSFLFTAAWKNHVLAGQMYIAIPFFLSLFTYVFCKAKTSSAFFLAGAIVLCLVLIRINFLVFLLPFLLLAKNVGLKRILLFCTPAFLWVILICLNGFERGLWKDYLGAIEQHSQMHQLVSDSQLDKYPRPNYPEWEGIVMKDKNLLSPGLNTENGNFFLMFKMVTGKNLAPVNLLLISSLSILALFTFFYLRSAKIKINDAAVMQVIIAGFCFYMITDIFSPITRHQCYTMQWLFIVLFFTATQPLKRYYSILIVVGLVLSITDFTFIKMRHTIGEYLILISLILHLIHYFKLRPLKQ